MSKTITDYEIEMTAIMLFAEDAVEHDMFHDNYTIKEAAINFDAASARVKRIYRVDAANWLGVFSNVPPIPARDVPAEPPVTLEDIKNKIKIPQLGDVVDALEGKASLDNVLGLEDVRKDRLTGVLNDDDYVKISAYIRDITTATGSLNVSLAMARTGHIQDPLPDLLIKTHALAIHVHSFMVLIDPKDLKDLFPSQLPDVKEEKPSER